MNNENLLYWPCILSCCKSFLKINHVSISVFTLFFSLYFLSQVLPSSSCCFPAPFSSVPSLSHTSHHKNISPSLSFRSSLPVRVFVYECLQPPSLYLSLPRPLWLFFKISVLISISVKLFSGASCTRQSEILWQAQSKVLWWEGQERITPSVSPTWLEFLKAGVMLGLYSEHTHL